MTESFEVLRLVGSVHAVSDDTESEMHRLDYLVDRLVASAAPAVTFTSLAEACVPLLGPRCIVDLVEDSGVAYSIERPRGSMSRLPGERGWADRCTVSAAATIPSSTLAAAGGSGYYAQVSSFCPVDRTPTEEREYLLQHLVDSAVELVRRERIQAALDAEHAVSTLAHGPWRPSMNERRPAAADTLSPVTTYTELRADGGCASAQSGRSMPRKTPPSLPISVARR